MKDYDSFYKENKNYLELKNKLTRWEDSQKLIELVGDAIQFGIERLAEDLKNVKKRL